MNPISAEGWTILAAVVLSHGVHIAVIRSIVKDLKARLIRLENMHLKDSRSG